MADGAQHPLVIIGAARSGTNMLRNVLSSLPGVATWPCDEIPFIWRHGNRGHRDDEFDPAMARPAVCSYIRGRFEGIRRADTRLVVEKTCANSLRPAFVDAVLPEARFLVIERNGHDAVASAMKRWTAGFDLRYSLAKARWVPFGDLPYYGMRYLRNRVERSLSSTRRLAVWGPVFKGMRDLPADIPLAELAARQWRRCVQRCDEDLSGIAADRVHRVKYEEFVATPAASLAAILEFLAMPIADTGIEDAVGDVRATSVGKAARSLSEAERLLIDRIAGETEAEVGCHG